MQQRGDQELVAIAQVHLTRDSLGGALGGDGVQTEALRRGVPARDALEKVEDGGAGGERLDPARGQHLDGLGDRGYTRALGRGRAVRDPQDRDHERDVGLDRRDDVADGGVLLAHQSQDAIARLRERREGLERLERGSQTAAMALARGLYGGVRALAGVGYRVEGSFHVRRLPVSWLG